MIRQRKGLHEYYNMGTKKFDFFFSKKFEIKFYLYFDLCWRAEIIQVGLNMRLYVDIGDASSSLWGSTSSFMSYQLIPVVFCCIDIVLFQLKEFVLCICDYMYTSVRVIAGDLFHIVGVFFNIMQIYSEDCTKYGIMQVKKTCIVHWSLNKYVHNSKWFHTY